MFPAAIQVAIVGTGPRRAHVQDLTSRGFLAELNLYAERSWLGGNQPLTFDHDLVATLLLLLQQPAEPRRSADVMGRPRQPDAASPARSSLGYR